VDQTEQFVSHQYDQIVADQADFAADSDDVHRKSELHAAHQTALGRFVAQNPAIAQLSSAQQPSAQQQIFAPIQQGPDMKNAVENFISLQMRHDIEVKQQKVLESLAKKAKDSPDGSDGIVTWDGVNGFLEAPIKIWQEEIKAWKSEMIKPSRSCQIQPIRSLQARQMM
jgi:hypothetical protein